MEKCTVATPCGAAGGVLYRKAVPAHALCPPHSDLQGPGAEPAQGFLALGKAP
jgi:hypothetical protein